MSNATSADANNVDFGSPALKAGPGERIRVVAESVSERAAEAYKTIEFTRDITLAAAAKDIRLGVRKPTAAAFAYSIKFFAISA